MSLGRDPQPLMMNCFTEGDWAVALIKLASAAGASSVATWMADMAVCILCCSNAVAIAAKSE